MASVLCFDNLPVGWVINGVAFEVVGVSCPGNFYGRVCGRYICLGLTVGVYEDDFGWR